MHIVTLLQHYNIYVNIVEQKVGFKNLLLIHFTFVFLGGLMKKITLSITLLILIFSCAAIATTDFGHDWVDKPVAGCRGRLVIRTTSSRDGCTPSMQAEIVDRWLACDSCGKAASFASHVLFERCVGMECPAGMSYVCRNCGIESLAKGGTCGVAVAKAALRK
jgi:hypothetical protein